MAHHFQITQLQADEYFKEALGSLAWWASQDVLATATGTLSDNHHYRNTINEYEARQLVRSLTPSLVNSIGVFLFDYPYERYKKECARLIVASLPAGAPLTRQQLNDSSQTAASEAFFADTWATQAGFQARFPRATVLRWQPPNNAFRSWAADCVRNTFAHAQTSFVVVNQVLQLELWNSADGNRVNANFDVQMNLADFLRLVKDCVDAFIISCVPGQRYEPLQKLMAHLG